MNEPICVGPLEFVSAAWERQWRSSLYTYIHLYSPTLLIALQAYYALRSKPAAGKLGRGGAALWTADGAVTTMEGTGRGEDGRGLGRGGAATPTGEPRVAGGGAKSVRTKSRPSLSVGNDESTGLLNPILRNGKTDSRKMALSEMKLLRV